MGLVVPPDRLDVVIAPASGVEVAAGLLVDRKEANRRAVFGRHVPEGGPVWHRQRRRAFTVVLDKLPDDTRLPQQLGYA